jgi:hypothetical protein
MKLLLFEKRIEGEDAEITQDARIVVVRSPWRAALFLRDLLELFGSRRRSSYW